MSFSNEKQYASVLVELCTTLSAKMSYDSHSSGHKEQHGLAKLDLLSFHIAVILHIVGNYYDNSM